MCFLSLEGWEMMPIASSSGGISLRAEGVEKTAETQSWQCGHLCLWACSVGWVLACWWFVGGPSSEPAGTLLFLVPNSPPLLKPQNTGNSIHWWACNNQVLLLAQISTTVKILFSHQPLSSSASLLHWSPALKMSNSALYLANAWSDFSIPTFHTNRHTRRSYN